jgi:acetyltransferase-like isoleucine patch superfamily enzyme
MVIRHSIKTALLRSLERVRRISRACLFRVRFCARAVKIDPSSWVSWRSVIRTNGGGSVLIGKNCEIHAFAMILTYGGDVVLGDDCSVNPFTIIYGHGGVQIGNGVRIAAHSVIVPGTHNIPLGSGSLRRAGVSAKGIVIGNDVWIGSGARLLDGIHVGSNAVIGAGSVVTRSVPSGVTVAGVPARVIRAHSDS